MFICIHAPDLRRGALLDCACAFSPRVEQTSADTVVLDMDGFEHLFGSPREMAGRIARRAAEMGLRVNVAVAGNPDAAVHAARGRRGITVIPPAQEAKFLGSLPLEILSPPEEIMQTLEVWGIRRFGELAALPEAGLAERFGPEGVRLQKLARGAGDRPLFPVTDPPVFEQFMELEYPVALLEPLSFVLAGLLKQLCAGLEAQALATNELRLRLILEDRSEHERALRLPFPMRASRAFLRLLQLDLAAHPPQAPVVGIRLSAQPAKPRVIQNGLFLPQAPEPEKLELTLARIARLVGGDNVGSPELLDTHRPDAFRIRRFQAPGAGGRGPGARGRRLAFRVFRPPLRAQVRTGGNAAPTWVTARGVRGRVVSAAGPWRASGDWWTAGAWARDEWDVALGDKSLCRIYRDLLTGAWFVEGAYD